jgi:ribonuclease J
MASGEHRHIKIKKGDTVVLSASQVPGNEKAVEATINNLYREGAEVITNKQLDIHSSGHAHREEIKLLLSILKPKYLIPIHGDYRRFIEHAKLAEEVGVPRDNSLILENGQIAEFDQSGGRVSSEKVPVGQVLIDGSGIGDVGEIVLRDRQTMAKDGIFAVILTVDGKNGKLLSSPDIISRGFVYMREAEELIENARDLAKKIHADAIKSGPNSLDNLKKVLRDKLGDYLYRQTQRSPMVIPVVIQI